VQQHRSGNFARYAIGNINRHLGDKLVADISDQAVKDCQNARLREGATPKTINEDVGFLLRFLGDRGDAIRLKMRRERTLKLRVRNDLGKAFSKNEKAALINAAKVGQLPSGARPTRTNPGTRSRYIRLAIALALNTAMRDVETRNLTWGANRFQETLFNRR
jgi:integrase